MTSATTPSGVAAASSTHSVGYEAWKLMDDNTASLWATAPGIVVANVTYEFTSSKSITKYSICPTNQLGELTYNPKAFTLKGWNGSSWITLDTQTNITTWAYFTKKVFTLASVASYSKFGLFITETNGATIVAFAKW